MNLGVIFRKYEIEDFRLRSQSIIVQKTYVCINILCGNSFQGVGNSISIKKVLLTEAL